MDGTNRSEHDDALRASDADREQTADELRQHHAAGRLTDDEFQDRFERCLAARTIGELKTLVTDLPRSVPEAARRRPPCVRPFLAASLVLLFVLLLGVVGHPWHAGAWPPHHWAPWPLVPLALVLLFVGGRGCGREYRSCGRPREA
jgi:hypothetical protein